MHRGFSHMRLTGKTLLIAVLLYFWGDVVRMAEAQISRPVNHLPGTIVYDMVQDVAGNIWFGSEDGLIRFDGHGFRRYSTADGLPGNTVLYLDADQSGRVWALDFTGSVSFVKQGKVHTTQSDPLLREAFKPGAIHTTIFTHADTAWVGWELDRIMRFDRDSYGFLNHPAKYNFSVRHIARDRRGNIVVASLDTLTLFLPGASQPSRAMAKKFSPGRVFYYHGVPYAPFGTAWQRMEFRDEPLSLPGTEPVPWVNPATETIKFPQPEIRGRMFTACELPEGYIALGTTQGLYFISPDPAVPVKAVLEGMFINRVLQDKQGNVWASTLGGGAFKFPAGFWKTDGFEAADTGLSSLRSVGILPDGSILFGTASETMGIYRNRQLSVSALPDQMESSFGLQLLLIDFWGDNIVLSSAESLYIGPLNEDGSVNFESGTYYPLGGAKAISVVSENRLYLAATSGVLQVDRTESGDVTLHQLVLGRVTSVAYHPEVGVIAGRSQGMWIVADDELVPYYPELESAQITDIRFIGENELLIATNGFGLWKADVRTDSLVRLFETDIRLQNIRDLQVDEAGSWWLATSTGVYHYDVQASLLTARDTGNIRQLSIRNGTLVYITSDVAVITDAVPFAKQPFDLTFNHPVLVSDQHRIPLLPATTSLSLPDFGGHFKAFETINLPYGNRTVKLDTSAPYFGAEGGSRYYYRLYPNDTAWQLAENPDFTFRTLRPGKYRIYLRAESPEAAATAGLVVPFIIEAPFWQKSWFLLFAFVLAVSLIGLSLKSQLNRIEKREQVRFEQYRKTVELEQQALTAMMNPHFVFNVLNAIRQFMANKEDGKADEYLQLFAKLIRLQLEATFRKRISLKEELDLLQMYAGLEKIRISKPFDFVISLSDDLQRETDEIEIPPMLIQPFLENAIIHGIQSAERPGLITLHISFKATNMLCVQLTDSGTGIDAAKSRNAGGHESLGIELIKQRLALLHPPAQVQNALKITSKNGEGTTITIEIPI